MPRMRPSNTTLVAIAAALAAAVALNANGDASQSSPATAATTAPAIEAEEQAEIAEFWPGAKRIPSLVDAGDQGIAVVLSLGIAEQQMTGYFLPPELGATRAAGWSAYLDSTRRVYVYLRTGSPEESRLLAARKAGTAQLVRARAYGLVGKALSDKAGLVVEQVL